MNKQLIAYFSRKGNNYVSGKIKNLPVGNTEVVAKMISEVTKGDLFNIETVASYSDDYNTCTVEAKKELQENARPEIISPPAALEEYETIFVGYPNWWGTMPMAVFTFLEMYDFSDKTIIPFCTHEGSGMGNSDRDIKKICREATVLSGLALHGGSVSSAGQAIENWIKGSQQ